LPGIISKQGGGGKKKTSRRLIGGGEADSGGRGGEACTYIPTNKRGKGKKGGEHK